MSKTEARWLFEKLFAALTTFAEAEGLRFICYCRHRSAVAQAALRVQGKSWVRRSQHQDWLAKDIVLIDQSNDCTWAHEIGDGYERLGRFWERLHPCARWGGRWGRDIKKPGKDPYHFELSRDILQERGVRA